MWYHLFHPYIKFMLPLLNSDFKTLILIPVSIT